MREHGMSRGGDPELDAVAGELGIAAHRALLEERWGESAAQPPPPGWPAAGEVREAAAYAALGAEITDACLACRDWVASSPLRLRLLWHCYYLLFRAPGASPALASGLPSLASHEDPAPLFGALLCLCAVSSMRALHASRGIPEETTAATLRDLGLWILEHRRTNGRLGLSQMGWLWHHLTGRILQLGRLQFEVTRFGEGFHVFSSAGGEIAVLAGEGMRFRPDGQFADADGVVATEGVRSARFADLPEGWEGELIDPLGFSTGAQTRLRRERWKPILGRGDPVLGVHIPAGGEPPGNGPMTDEACGASFAQAARIFPRYFPEHGARACTCHSWLMDSQLRLYLPETANIILFQKRYHLLPSEGAGPAQHFERVFGFGVQAPASEAELGALERRLEASGRSPSTVERALIEHMRRGHVWRAAGGVIPFEAGNQT